MSVNRIRAARKRAGLTLEDLAARLDLSTSHLSRLESGRRTLSTDAARRIADALGIELAEVLGLDRPSGLAEDAIPFDDGPQADAPAIRPGANQTVYQVRTDVLSALDIRSGDLIVIDFSAAAVAGVQPLDIVLAQVYDATELTRSTTVLRQFVPPQLLITNASDDNSRPIRLEADDAHIKGIGVSFHRGLRNTAAVRARPLQVDSPEAKDAAPKQQDRAAQRFHEPRSRSRQR